MKIFVLRCPRPRPRHLAAPRSIRPRCARAPLVGQMRSATRNLTSHFYHCRKILLFKSQFTQRRGIKFNSKQLQFLIFFLLKSVFLVTNNRALDILRMQANLVFAASQRKELHKRQIFLLIHTNNIILRNRLLAVHALFAVARVVGNVVLF